MFGNILNQQFCSIIYFYPKTSFEVLLAVKRRIKNLIILQLTLKYMEIHYIYNIFPYKNIKWISNKINFCYVIVIPFLVKITLKKYKITWRNKNYFMYQPKITTNEKSKFGNWVYENPKWIQFRFYFLSLLSQLNFSFY